MPRLIASIVSATRGALPAEEAARDAELGVVAALAREETDVACDAHHAVETGIEADALAEESRVARDRLAGHERRRSALVARRAFELARRVLLIGGDRVFGEAGAVALARL